MPRRRSTTEEKKKLDAFYIELGLRIKEARKKNNLLQEDLARKIQASRLSISRIEAGRQQFNVFLLSKIAKVVNESVDALLP